MSGLKIQDITKDPKNIVSESVLEEGGVLLLVDGVAGGAALLAVLEVAQDASAANWKDFKRELVFSGRGCRRGDLQTWRQSTRAVASMK